MNRLRRSRAARDQITGKITAAPPAVAAGEGGGVPDAHLDNPYLSPPGPHGGGTRIRSAEGATRPQGDLPGFAANGAGGGAGGGPLYGRRARTVENGGRDAQKLAEAQRYQDEIKQQIEERERRRREEKERERREDAELEARIRREQQLVREREQADIERERRSRAEAEEAALLGPAAARRRRAGGGDALTTAGSGNSNAATNAQRPPLQPEQPPPDAPRYGRRARQAGPDGASAGEGGGDEASKRRAHESHQAELQRQIEEKRQRKEAELQRERAESAAFEARMERWASSEAPLGAAAAAAAAGGGGRTEGNAADLHRTNSSGGGGGGGGGAGGCAAVIEFHAHDGPHGYMSNFSPHGFTIRGTTFPTCEHFFQAMKFAHSPVDFAFVVSECATPKEAAKAGRDRSRPLRADWDSVKDSVMLDGLREKFAQNAAIREQLIATGACAIVERSDKDNYWGDGPQRDGKNMLGKLLMRVRDELRGHGGAGVATSLPQGSEGWREGAAAAAAAAEPPGSAAVPQFSPRYIAMHPPPPPHGSNPYGPTDLTMMRDEILALLLDQRRHITTLTQQQQMQGQLYPQPHQHYHLTQAIGAPPAHLAQPPPSYRNFPAGGAPGGLVYHTHVVDASGHVAPVLAPTAPQSDADELLHRFLREDTDRDTRSGHGAFAPSSAAASFHVGNTTSGSGGVGSSDGSPSRAAPLRGDGGLELSAAAASSHDAQQPRWMGEEGEEDGHLEGSVELTEEGTPLYVQLPKITIR